MKKYITRIAASLTLVVYTIWVGSTAVLAATPVTPAQAPAANVGQALEIAPPVINLKVNPGQTVSTQIYIRDVSNGNLIVTGEANDFVAAGEDGAPKVILDNNTNDPYSLRNWVAPLPSLNLIPKEIKSLTVTFKVPTDASPGGHYGTIRFTGRAPSLQGSGVSLSASIGALVLLTVSGDIKENLSVQEFTISKDGKAGSFFQSGPLTFTERLKNTGNVHVQPVGKVTVTDMFGRKLATVNVNQPPGNVLPNSTRKFTQNLDKSVIGDKKLFGRYKAKLEVTYGDKKQVLTSTKTFWVIPYRTVAIVIVALVAIFFIVRFAIKRYNRYILRRSQGGPR
jgi:hypothetical protein